MSRGMKPHDVGIYMILSSLMHDRQEPLAYEAAWLARYCGTSKSAFQKAVDRLVYDGLFWLENGRLGSEHIQNELARCDEITEKARSSANARHRKSKENQSTGDADAMRNKKKTSDTDVEGKTQQGSSPSTTQSTSSPNQPDHKQDTRPSAPESASGAPDDDEADWEGRYLEFYDDDDPEKFIADYDRDKPIRAKQEAWRKLIKWIGGTYGDDAVKEATERMHAKTLTIATIKGFGRRAADVA